MTDEAQAEVNADGSRNDANPAVATLLTRSTRCVSVPCTTVSTYTPRRTLSEQLSEKLSKAYPGRALSHAVAVMDLDGTGKTQLVLHHIEDNEDEYYTIL